jgi:hypothetical protein
MKLTIIVPDGSVILDGVFKTVDLSPFQFGNLRAVQWTDTKGREEYSNGVQREIASLDRYAGVIAAFSDQQPSEPTAPSLSLTEAKQRRLREIAGEAQAAVDALATNYPDFEKLTWKDQESEALALLEWNGSGAAPSTPTVDGIASSRGIDKTELCQRIIAKADLYRPAAAQIIGKRQRLEDLIEAATTADEVKAIKW